MADAKTSPRGAEQGLRMCKLRQEGNIEGIDQRSVRPKAVCLKCGAKADEPDYVCNPRQL
jgi:hypothetical protein